MSKVSTKIEIILIDDRIIVINSRMKIIVVNRLYLDYYYRTDSILKIESECVGIYSSNRQD